MAESDRRTRPIAGALWGVLLGLGLTLLAVNAKIISLALVPMIIVVVIGIALGVVWSMFGPAKGQASERPSSPS